MNYTEESRVGALPWCSNNDVSKYYSCGGYLC